MKKIIIVVSLSLCFIACKTMSNEKTTKQSSILEKSKIANVWIHNKIDSTLKANNIPGLAIGIVDEGKLKFAGYGTKARNVVEVIDENSIFQIGSDTKKFTAIIVRNLVEEGKLELDKPIIEYLPNTITIEAKEKLKNVTLKLLLLHRSGIPNRAPSNKRIDGDPMIIPYTEKDLIFDLNNIVFDFEPDAKMSYSNLGYATAGYICELVSNKDYSELLKFYITDKYDMKNTFIVPNKSQHPMIVTPYRKDDRMINSQPWNMGKMTPAGGIYSNIVDLSKLMKAQIKTYRSYNKNGNRINTLILTESDGIEGTHYGFGLHKSIEGNWSKYGHGGDLDGYGSGYVFSPEKNIGLIMLTSSGGRWFGELENEIKTDLFKRGNTK